MLIKGRKLNGECDKVYTSSYSSLAKQIYVIKNISAKEL